MKKTILKIKERLGEAKVHPLARINPYAAILRYIYLNLRFKFQKEVCVKWLYDLKLLIRKGDAALIGNYYFRLADFNDSAFVLHFLREEDLFIDIGANLGHFSILASGVVGAKSILFEPVPSTFKQLSRNLKINNLNTHVILFNVGLSNTKANLWFSDDKNNMNSVVDENYPKAVNVEVETLDAVIHVDRIAILKIDVEGFEKFVLEGATKTISNPLLKVIIIELNGSGIKFGVDENGIHEELTNSGFKPFVYDGLTRRLVELKKQNTSTFNTIYVRDTSFVFNRIEKGKEIKVNTKIF